MHDSLLSPAEAAEHLNVPVETLRVWRSRGLGPRYFKIGRHCRYHPEDLDRFIKARVVEPRKVAP